MRAGDRRTRASTTPRATTESSSPENPWNALAARQQPMATGVNVRTGSRTRVRDPLRADGRGRGGGGGGLRCAGERVGGDGDVELLARDRAVTAAAHGVEQLLG